MGSWGVFILCSPTPPKPVPSLRQWRQDCSLDVWPLQERLRPSSRSQLTPITGDFSSRQSLLLQLPFLKQRSGPRSRLP